MTCHLAWRTCAFPIPCCVPRRTRTTTADRAAEGWTGAEQAGREGPGAQRGETDASGCKWILARLPEWRVSLLREDRIPCSGWKPIIFRTARMDIGLYLTKRMAELRLVRGCLHRGRKILALVRSWKAEQLFVWFRCRNFGRGGYQVEKKSKTKLSAYSSWKPGRRLVCFSFP